MEIINDKEFVYSAPHDIIWIYDKSGITDVPSETANAVALIPFVSDRGRDRQFMLFRGASTFAGFQKEFGTRNMRKHGQPLFNATETLRNGGWCIGYRVTADDATYANALIMAHVKITENNVSVKLKTETLENFTSDSTLEALMESKITEADTYHVLPLFAVYSKGRGVYGNDFAIRLTEAKVENESSAFANYNCEIQVNNRGSIEVEGPYHCTLDPNGRYNNQSIHIERLMSRLSNNVTIAACEEAFEKLTEILTPVAVHHNVPVSKIDILVPEVTSFVTHETGEGIIDIENAYGIRLAGGSDGSWSGKFDWDSPSRSSMTKAFSDFYDGTANGDINNLLKIAPSYILDAGYPLATKTAMATLLRTRLDVHGYFDIGFIRTVTQAVDYMTSFPANGLWNASAYAQNMLILDADNDKEVKVTATLALARALPNHYKNHGSHRPLAGMNYGKLTGIIPGSIYPKANNLATEKDPLYKAKLNYIEEGEDYYMFGSQITLNSNRSKLSHVNNARMTSEMVRILLKLVRQYRFEFTEEEDIKEFVRQGNQAIASYRDKTTYLKYTVTQTPYEKERNILHDALDVQFKDIVEKNRVSISVLGNN